jgi:hypothetical protein
MVRFMRGAVLSTVVAAALVSPARALTVLGVVEAARVAGANEFQPQEKRLCTPNGYCDEWAPRACAPTCRWLRDRRKAPDTGQWEDVALREVRCWAVELVPVKVCDYLPSPSYDCVRDPDDQRRQPCFVRPAGVPLLEAQYGNGDTGPDMCDFPPGRPELVGLRVVTNFVNPANAGLVPAVELWTGASEPAKFLCPSCEYSKDPATADQNGPAPCLTRARQ